MSGSRVRTRQNNSTLGGPGPACIAWRFAAAAVRRERSIIILMISVFLIEPLRPRARPRPSAPAPRARCAVPSPA